MNFKFGGRLQGKSFVMKRILEETLNSGKTVLVFAPSGVTLQRRKKHLTLMVTVNKKLQNEK